MLALLCIVRSGACDRLPAFCARQLALQLAVSATHVRSIALLRVDASATRDEAD